MGNVLDQEKIKVEVKRRCYDTVNLNIPPGQLIMIKALQKAFDYEVKGTFYVDHEYHFKSFEIRTDNSEIYSYGASNWKISFHTHPDKTAQKYGVRYFSPPSVDDVMEIYDHSIQFAPEDGLGEISVIFTNEGVYVLQVNRELFKKFNKDNLPLCLLEEVLKDSLTAYFVNQLKRRITELLAPATVDFSDPNITVTQYYQILTDLAAKVEDDFGFVMTYHSWEELERDGLQLKVCKYFVNDIVDD